MQTVKLRKPDSEAYADELRYDARLAFLDGHTRQAKALNKAADLMSARLRDLHDRRADSAPFVVTFTIRNDNPNTIWNCLARKLGREPTSAEACEECRRLLAARQEEVA